MHVIPWICRLNYIYILINSFMKSSKFLDLGLSACKGLLTTILILCGTTMVTSCIDRDPAYPFTPESKLISMLEGSWYMDADGREDIDALFVEMQLHPYAQSMLRFVGYDFENDLYDDFFFPVTCKVLRAGGGNYLMIDFDLEALKEL